MSQRWITILADPYGEPVGSQIKAILGRESHFRVDLVGLNERLEAHPELIIPVLPASRESVEKLLPQLQALDPDVAVLPVISSDNLGKIEDLCVWTKDFLVSPIRELEVCTRINRILDRSRKKFQEQGANRIVLSQLVGEDDAFMVVKRKIPLIAQSECAVLIVGETGTGKELCARAIHYLSRRSNKPFLPVNCGAIPVELFERELFGHQKGAFTSAWAAQPGLIAEAEGGSLFLDEIDTLGLGAQVKLLRFLQDKAYCVLGSPKLRQGDVRIIASTNLDLGVKVQEGSFRQDLLYRLAVLVINLPPLRDRPADIPLLAGHFWKTYSENNGQVKKRLSSRALQALCRYSWPGNVRELENIIQRLLVLSEGEIVEPKDLPILLRGPSCEPESASFKQAKADAIERFERAYITDLLQRHHGNVTHAAVEAKKDRRAFGRLIKKYHIPKCRTAR